MHENHLSFWGKRIAIGFMILGTAYAIYAAISETGIARPILLWQVRNIGGYSMKLTGAILLVPAVLGGYAVGFLFDLAIRRGAFARPAIVATDPATFGLARKVRIIAVPPGEAPESIRQAWVGLELPLAAGESGPRNAATHGVLTGPKTMAGEVSRALQGYSIQKRGYLVDAASAFEVLEIRAPGAARWWEANAPHAMKAGRMLHFAADVCLEI